MSKKYLTDRLITNDLYLAAFLLCSGCELARLEHNGRRRVSFVVVGEDAKKFRCEYENGEVWLNVRSFKENLKTVRVAMTSVTDPRPPRLPDIAGISLPVRGIWMPTGTILFSLNPTP